MILLLVFQLPFRIPPLFCFSKGTGLLFSPGAAYGPTERLTTRQKKTLPQMVNGPSLFFPQHLPSRTPVLSLKTWWRSQSDLSHPPCWACTETQVAHPLIAVMLARELTSAHPEDSKTEKTTETLRQLHLQHTTTTYVWSVNTLTHVWLHIIFYCWCWCVCVCVGDSVHVQSLTHTLPQNDASKAKGNRRGWGNDDNGCRLQQARISVSLLPSRKEQLTWKSLKSRQNAFKPSTRPANLLKTSPSLYLSLCHSLFFPFPPSHSLSSALLQAGNDEIVL